MQKRDAIRPVVWHSFVLWLGKLAVKMKISKIAVAINNPFKCLRQQAETMLPGKSDAAPSKVSLETCRFCPLSVLKL